MPAGVGAGATAAGTTRDSFGRLRTSEPFTLFDSKQLYDNLPLYYDDQEVSGGGTTSTYSSARASTTIGVSSSIAGKRIRQTFQRFNYQPGKSQEVLLTGILSPSGGGTGIQSAMGLFDDNNGIFVRYNEGTIEMVIRSSVTGSPVDNSIPQSQWNGDKLDGNNTSKYTLDPTKAQIFWCDLEWLGVGSVRCGFVINGELILCHTFRHANSLASVYMSTPNLPVRYEIENDGTGVASTLEHICSTVISEGGQQNTGQLHYVSTEGTHCDCNVANTLYGIIGVRLRSDAPDNHVDFAEMSMLNGTVDDFEWVLVYDPTVTGTLTYSGHPNSVCEVAVAGGTPPTITGGTPVIGGFVKSSGNTGAISSNLDNALRIGTAIDGTQKAMILCCRPLSANADIDAGIGWRELS